jgi:hypothetical protein
MKYFPDMPSTSSDTERYIVVWAPSAGDCPDNNTFYNKYQNIAINMLL